MHFSPFSSRFVNAAFGTDKLLTEDGNKWIYKNKEHGMMSAMASLGLLLLWDVDGGLTQVNEWMNECISVRQVQYKV